MTGLYTIRKDPETRTTAQPLGSFSHTFYYHFAFSLRADVLNVNAFFRVPQTYLLVPEIKLAKAK